MEALYIIIVLAVTVTACYMVSKAILKLVGNDDEQD